MNTVHRIRELMRRIRLLAPSERETAKNEAMLQIRQRSIESDPQQVLEHRKELTMKLSFLKTITPKVLMCDKASDADRSSTFVLRDGELIRGTGEVRGGRVADGVLSSEEAFRRNDRDFKPFF